MKFRMLAALAFLFAFCGLAFAGDYPKPYGHVNDFANILPRDVAKKLETELRTYKEQTSIEIAVVTVKSLEGLSVEEYTIELARRWGVGEKKKDNGVVLLVAPNERKARIEVGYGLEPDLTDAQSGRIMQNRIIPLFKKGEMAEGVVAGVAGILEELGATPYAARAEERERTEAARRESAERTAENLKTFLFFAVVFGVATLIVIFTIRAVRRHAERKRQLQKLHKENNSKLQESALKIKEASAEYTPTKMLLEKIKKENPKEVWSDLENELEMVPNKVQSMTEALAKNTALHARGWNRAGENTDLVQGLYAETLKYSSVYELVKARSEEIDQAKKKSKELLSSLPGVFKEIADKLDHPDVGSEAKNALKDAERKFAGVGAMLKLPVEQMINWLTVYLFLSGAVSLADSATKIAKQNQGDAERARKEGPKLLKELPESIKKAESAISDSDVSSSTKQKVGEAKVKYAKAKMLAGEGNLHTDWLSAFALLTAAATLLQTAVSNAGSEKDDAERARRRSRENYNTSPTIIIGGGGGGGGGDFGGFGGGSFGGGGASGSW